MPNLVVCNTATRQHDGVHVRTEACCEWNDMQSGKEPPPNSWYPLPDADNRKHQYEGSLEDNLDNIVADAKEKQSKSSPLLNKREQPVTGSQRDSRKGKGRFDLLPPYAIKQVAMHFERGAERYDERNWEKGQPLSWYMDSALRHIFNHLDGKRDEQHMVSAAWNLLAFIETEHRINEGRLPTELYDLPDATNVDIAELIRSSKHGE